MVHNSVFIRIEYMWKDIEYTMVYYKTNYSKTLPLLTPTLQYTVNTIKANEGYQNYFLFSPIKI